VKGGRHLSALDKAALDLWYVRHASLAVDCEIALRTAVMVLFGEKENPDAIRRAWDELIDPRRLYEPLRRADLDAELDALLAPVEPEDLEQQMERLRQFAHGNMLRVAAADLTGVVPLMKVSDYLSEIGEATVARVLRLAFQHLAGRHGPPKDLKPDETGLLVLGYGKLGGLELGYGSDLDLVFVHGSDQGWAETLGSKSISHEQFYSRLG
jgi:glutamate-ammonia-ligase adenylyltransferase